MDVCFLFHSLHVFLVWLYGKNKTVLYFTGNDLIELNLPALFHISYLIISSVVFINYDQIHSIDPLHII